MSAKLRQYLVESYFGDREYLTQKVTKDIAIQIDDQDDNDNINEFCNIFVCVHNRGKFTIELIGVIPYTQAIFDLVEIYDGTIDKINGRLILDLNINQIELILDLAKLIHDTAQMGKSIQNPNWHRIASRTISSLYRLVRIVKEYQKMKNLFF